MKPVTKLSQLTTNDNVKSLGVTVTRTAGKIVQLQKKIVDKDTYDQYIGDLKAELGEYWDQLEDDLLPVAAAVPETSAILQQHVDMHNELLRQFEITRREQSDSTRQLSDTAQQMSDRLEGLSAHSKKGFDDLQQTVTISSNALGDGFERTLATTNILLQQLIEKQAGKTQIEPAADAPGQSGSVKPELAEQEDDRESNASSHLTPQASPQNSPVKTEAN